MLLNKLIFLNLQLEKLSNIQKEIKEIEENIAKAKKGTGFVHCIICNQF